MKRRRLRKLNDEIETPLIGVLVDMEANGIAVDPAILKSQSAVLGERIDALRLKIMEAAGGEFNPDSPKQLGDVLFNRLKLKSVKKTRPARAPMLRCSRSWRTSIRFRSWCSNIARL